MPKQTLNPPELFPSLQYGFSQIVTATAVTTVYLSGQVAWDANQQIVGAGDLRAQTWQALHNVATAVAAAGGRLSDVVSMRIYIVETVLDQSRHVSDALKTFFPPEHAPATTWIGVCALANRDFLIEIEAIAALDQPAPQAAGRPHDLAV